MLLVSLNVGFLIAEAVITNSSYLVIFFVQEIFTLVVYLTPCARAPPMKEYNYYITCYLGNTTGEVRDEQHSCMLPR